MSQTADMLFGLPGVRVTGQGANAEVSSVFGRTGANKCVGMRILQNGFLHLDNVNDVPPSTIAAIEIFTQGAFAPTQYSIRGSCGVMVIWTNSARRRPVAPAAKGDDATSP